MRKEPRDRISGTRRNLGLRNVRSGTRWLAAGAAALTGTFTAFAAHSTIDAAKLQRTPSRGSTTTTSPTTTSPSTNGTNPDDGTGASNGATSNGSDDGSQWSYQAPSQPPTQTTQPPVASSGGT